MLPSSLLFDAVRVTEQAAIAASHWIGRGDNTAADQAAVDAMRQGLMALEISGIVVIGEGERDEAPMLYIGEEVGRGGTAIDIALDPLEGTTICAHQGDNALAVLAFAPKGAFLHAPDVYMEKIAVAADIPRGAISLENSPHENIKIVAKTRGKDVKDITVCILERERHQDLIEAVRQSGARVKLIGDGDIFAVIETAQAHSGIDLYMGSGGAPEGVLAAAALRALGGDIQGKLLFRNDDERFRARKTGIEDFDRIYKIEELASGDEMIFCATAVTDGKLISGVKRHGGKAQTQSLVIDLHSSCRRIITNQAL